MNADFLAAMPGLPGFIWRPLEPADAPAFHALQAACAAYDHLPAPQSLEALRVEMEKSGQALHNSTLCAARGDGVLAAAAWITFDDSLHHELRAYLAGWVHPAHRERGVLRSLISWMENRADECLAQYPDKRPRVLRLDVEHQDEQLFAVYEVLGYHLTVTEETMRRTLTGPLPGSPLPAGIRLFPYSPERAEHFHSTYLAAFRDRPGFPAWDLETWRAAYTGEPGFSPELSLLALDGAVGAAYAVSAVKGQTGWVLQMGVSLNYRRRGLGAGLLASLLRRFQAAGLVEAALDVNLNNEGARKLYARLGFVPAGVSSSFRKILAAG